MNRNFQHYIDLIIVLTQKEIKVRYKSSIFGYLWSVGHPLAFAFVFFVAFKVVMRIQMEDYALFLIAGLFPWQWFANSVNVSPMIFLTNSSIIKKVDFPRNIIPFTMVLQDMIHFVLAIPVIILFIFIYHKSISFSWLYGIPILLILQFLMTYGVCLIVSSINLFFRDLERMTSLLIMLLFYFTPVIYSEMMIPERYKDLIALNPLALLIISWRNLFLYGQLELSILMICAGYSIFTFLISCLIFKKLSWRFAEVL